MNKVEKLSTVPAAFSGIAAKVNEVIDANPPLKAGRFIKITTSNENVLISADITAEELDTLLQQVYPRTFYVTAGTGTEANVSAGAINNVAYAAATITSLSNGDKIYIDATVTTGTDTVTAVTVSKAATVPTDTTTHAYTLLATVAVASSQATVTPVAWNYSQLQLCFSEQYLWGGFGG